VLLQGLRGAHRETGDPRPYPAAISALVLKGGRGEGTGKVTAAFKPTIEEIVAPYVKAVPVCTNWIRRLTYEKRKNVRTGFGGDRKPAGGGAFRV
jgi:hypothetical protein